MPPRIELEHQRDFTGGLNVADDPINLEPTESFALINVDIDRRGGFGIRRGSRRWIEDPTTLSEDVDSIYTYVDPSGVRHLLAASEGQVQRWNGTTWVEIQAAVSAGTTWFIEMEDALYLVHASRSVTRWTGSGSTTAITAAGFNDNLGAPANNRMIHGRCAAVHNGVLFMANIIDSLDAATHQSRIRWSHPNKPRDWRTNDWIDIDPEDGCGPITALVPMADRLVIFKERAIYTLHGFPPEGFSVTAITRDVGTPSNYSLSATESVVYFWDVRKGAFELTERSLKWIFRPLYPYIDDNQMDLAMSADTLCEFHNDRAWFSVPWTAAPYSNLNLGLVYAPTVGQGAWTLHDRTAACLHVHRASSGADVHLLGGNGLYVMELDVANYYVDETPDTEATSRIDASYTTRWFDAKNKALQKRFKRPIVVVGLNADQEFHVDVFSDYDPTSVKRSFSLFTFVDEAEGVWDVDNWDEANWAGEIGEAAKILRGSPLSNGTARALRFSNVTSGVDWRIHGLTIKWVSKRIRN